MPKRISQTEKLRRLLSDGNPHSTVEIMDKVYGGSHLGIARVGARVHDLRTKGHPIKGWQDPEDRTLWWYRMEAKPKPKVEFVNIDGVMHVRLVS